MHRRPRVIHYVSTPGVGGLERVVELLATAQHGMGRDVHVAAMLDRRQPDPPILAALSQHSVPVHVQTFASRAYLHERRALARLCRDLGATHVHSHGYRADVINLTLARGAGARTVSTVHGYTGGGWLNRVYERIQTTALRRFDAVVAVARPLAALLRKRGIAESRLHVIPNAWRPGGDVLDRSLARLALGLDPGSFVIGFVGRLSREKGADVLLEALNILRNDEWTAVIVGDGQERPALEQQARRLDLWERVVWRPRFDRANRIMRAFDVLVLSSRTEGTPMVLFEAIDAGVPVVATRVGGVPDVVDEESAWLTGPDDPAGVAAQMRLLQASPLEAKSKADNALSRVVTRFAPQEWVEAYDRVYQGVANSRHSDVE